jgi:altronate hydrolase
VVALTHGTGCGMDTEGMGMQILERTLAGYATHANFWGVLVVGLGCEANQINAWLATAACAKAKPQGLQHPGHRRHTQDR